MAAVTGKAPSDRYLTFSAAMHLVAGLIWLLMWASFDELSVIFLVGLLFLGSHMAAVQIIGGRWRLLSVVPVVLTAGIWLFMTTVCWDECTDNLTLYDHVVGWITWSLFLVVLATIVVSPLVALGRRFVK